MQMKEAEVGVDFKNMTQDQQIEDLHKKLQTLVQKLDHNINNKHETLVIRQRELQRYHEQLNQKYAPIFIKMQHYVIEKKFEYLDYLTKHLEDNDDKVVLEKETLAKLQKSFNEIKPYFQKSLEEQTKRIEAVITRQKKL
jgi:cation transport regulator ChaC